MSEFNLSEKKIDVPTLNEEHAFYYPEEYVKEFIELLKEKCDSCQKMANESKIKDEHKVGDWCCESCPIKREIDKLAGDDLSSYNGEGGEKDETERNL